MTSIGIIGGGLAGLSAGFYLSRLDPGCQLQLLEASDRWGGVIRTQRIDGFLLEHGADMFATQPAAALQLCRDLGLAETLISPQPSARGAGIVHRGRAVKIPEGFVLMRPTRLSAMITTPLLSPLGKLRLLGEGLVRPRRDDDDESVASFVTRRLGPEVLQRIVQPLVGGIYTGDVTKLSMAATMPQFLQMERQYGSLWAATRQRKREGIDSTERNSAGARYEQFRSLPNGMQQLIDALVAAIAPEAMQLHSPISTLRRQGNRWQLVGPAAPTEPLDHVILATPARVTARLLSEVAPQAAAALQGIEAASSAIVALGVQTADIARPLDVAGLVVPAAEGRRILAASFTSEKFAGRAPQGQTLIRVFIGGALQPALLQSDDDCLIDIARQELSELIGLRGSPTLARVIRWDHAMPQYHVGHHSRIASLQQALQQTPGLHVIGNSLHGVGIAPTVAGAVAVAQRIVKP